MLCKLRDPVLSKCYRPRATLIRHCRCGKFVDRLGLHGLSCIKNAGRLPRHSAITSILKRSLTRIGLPSVLEPVGLTSDRRPDGLTLNPWYRGRSLIWDATVCFCCVSETVSNDRSLLNLLRDLWKQKGLCCLSPASFAIAAGIGSLQSSRCTGFAVSVRRGCCVARFKLSADQLTHGSQLTLAAATKAVSSEVQVPPGTDLHIGHGLGPRAFWGPA